jgi:hypothetical protein
MARCEAKLNDQQRQQVTALVWTRHGLDWISETAILRQYLLTTVLVLNRTSHGLGHDNDLVFAQIQFVSQASAIDAVAYDGTQTC